MDQPQLHVFTNGDDKVIAADIDDAWAVWCESIGEKREDYDDGDFWKMLDDNEPLTIWHDVADFHKCKCRETLEAHGARADKRRELISKLPEAAQNGLWAAIEIDRPKTYPNGHVKGCSVGATTMTCAGWIAQEKRGFLCTVNM